MLKKQIAILSSTLEKTKIDLSKASLELTQAKEDVTQLKSTLKKKKKFAIFINETKFLAY